MGSSGKWGCGVFGGDPAHKFIQQVVASSLANCKLHFSTFGAPDNCDRVLGIIKAVQPTTSQLLRALLPASAASRERRDFVRSFGQFLEQHDRSNNESRVVSANCDDP